ncbi:MAG: hypothetical protein U0Y08_15595 [Bacteroidia bacterium]
MTALPSNLYRYLLAGLMLLSCSGFAQVNDSIKYKKPVYFHLYDTPGCAGAKLSVGVGLNNFKSGIITEDGTDVMISAGGGVAAGIFFNTPLSKKWVLGNEINFHVAELLTPLQNATGMFTHFSYMPNIKHAILFPNKIMAILPFAGPVIAFKGKYDLDATKITNGARNIFYYKAGTGFSLGCEFMIWAKRRRIGGIAGLRYTGIKYSLKEASSNGTKFTRDQVEKLLDKDILDPKGNAIDATAAFIYLF